MNTQTSSSLNVLVVGNNPTELGTVLETLKQVRSQKIITEIAFDLKTILQRLVRFDPNYILIDDNIGRHGLMATLKQLASNRKTKDIPITVLKNSNYQESFGSEHILDYLLKQNLSADAVLNALRNSLKFRRAHIYLQKVYLKRKRDLLKLAHK